MQIWDTSSVAWLNSVEDIFTYHLDGNLSFVNRDRWSRNKMDWVKFRLESFTYDGNKDKVGRLNQAWDDIDSAWVNDLKDTWEYNANRDLVANDFYYFWDESSIRYNFHYREEYICAQMTQTKDPNKDKAYFIFPNPVSNNTVTIHSESGDEFRLLDISGNTVFRSILDKGANQVKLGSLTSGIYIAKVGKKIQKLWVK